MSAAQSFEVRGRSQRGWLSESIEAAIEAEAIGSVVVRARESSPSSRKWPQRHSRLQRTGSEDKTARRGPVACVVERVQEVIENPLDDGRILDKGETAKRAELATTRSFPPQRRQTSMSMAKTRLRRSA